MVDETNKPAAAPSAGSTPNPNPVTGAVAPSKEAEKTDINYKEPVNDAAADAAKREGRVGNFQPAVGAAPTPKVPGRSGLVTNPEPVVDPDAPVAPTPNAPAELPAATIAEMQAGAEALERNKPARIKRDDKGKIERDADGNVVLEDGDAVDRRGRTVARK